MFTYDSNTHSKKLIKNNKFLKCFQPYKHHFDLFSLVGKIHQDQF